MGTADSKIDDMYEELRHKVEEGVAKRVNRDLGIKLDIAAELWRESRNRRVMDMARTADKNRIYAGDPIGDRINYDIAWRYPEFSYIRYRIEMLQDYIPDKDAEK